jgi:2-hydroxycyclohexanecarboxyl-CoA dehydrogenase
VKTPLTLENVSANVFEGFFEPFFYECFYQCKEHPIMRGLTNKVVVVTGGAGGIGAATCRRFGEEGAKVAVVDINLAAAQGLATELQAAGGQAQAFAIDITDPAAVVAGVAQIEAALEPIDVLVNNAGWDKAGMFLKTDQALWERIVAINLYGALHMHHVVLKGMSERGRVVNVASDAARVGSSGEAVYALCKGGLIAFSKRSMSTWSAQGRPNQR